MKKAITVTLVVLVFCAALIVWWNPVIVVHSYSETRTWDDYSMSGGNEWLAKSLGLGVKRSVIVTVVVKQRVLTGETWKEYVQELPVK
jgi:hypothetical protein